MTRRSHVRPGLAAAWRPALRGEPPSAPLAAKSPTLSLADPPMQGEVMTGLQQRLTDMGYDVGAVDGIYGARTQAAVRQFQQAHSLDVDGITGPLTWAAIRFPDAPAWE